MNERTGCGSEVECPRFENLLMLPRSAGARFYEQKLIQDERVLGLLTRYEERNFKFIPDRVRVYVGLSTSAEENYISEPFTLTIIPSFQYFPPDAPSHEAVGISVYRSRGRQIILATEVSVSHRPFRLSAFRTVDLDAEEGYRTNEVARQELAGMTTEELAKHLGPVNVEPPEAEEPLGSTTPRDNAILVKAFLEETMTDIYSTPLYPEGGIEELLGETPLAVRLAAAQRLRYRMALTGPGRAGEDGGWCCSTSSSCNSCTSTSTTCNIDVCCSG